MPAIRQTLLEFLNQDIGSLLSKNARVPSSHARAKALRSARHLAPFGTGQIKGQLVSSKGMVVPVTLWDLSESGCCVVVHGPHSLEDEHDLIVSMQDSAGPDELRLSGNLRWCDRVAGTTLAGLDLDESPAALRQTFLGRYLEPSA